MDRRERGQAEGAESQVGRPAAQSGQQRPGPGNSRYRGRDDGALRREGDAQVRRDPAKLHGRHRPDREPVPALPARGLWRRARRDGPCRRGRVGHGRCRRRHGRGPRRAGRGIKTRSRAGSRGFAGICGQWLPDQERADQECRGDHRPRPPRSRAVCPGRTV